MANELKMAKVHSILTLHQQGHSYRRIAELLGVHRETVARYVHQASKPAKAPPGSIESKPAKAPLGSDGIGAGLGRPGVTRRSDCELYRGQILAKLEQGLSAQRIYQDLVDEHADVPSYHSVKRFVRRLGQAQPLPMRRLECEPGADG